MIRILHALLIGFVVITPIMNDPHLLLLHAVIVPFIILHWIANNNTCALSTLEMYLKNKNFDQKNNREDCFTCNIFDPIYDFRKNYNKFTTMIYLITLLLWLIGIRKLMEQCNEGVFSSWYDLLTKY